MPAGAGAGAIKCQVGGRGFCDAWSGLFLLTAQHVADDVFNGVLFGERAFPILHHSLEEESLS